MSFQDIWPTEKDNIVVNLFNKLPVIKNLYYLTQSTGGFWVIF